MTGINLAHQIAARHADKMTPVEIVEYVKELNNEIFNRMIKPGA
jgi:iron-sulfur cluster repair protein YtfE (RIC family)